MSFGTAIAVVILFAFFIQFSPSRAVYIYVLAIGTALMLGHRALSTFIKARLFERGIGVDSALIVGESESARRLAQTILGQPRWGYRLVGFVSNNDLEQMNVATEAGIRATPRLGGTEDVNTLTQQWHIDEVFIVEEDHSHETISRMIESCRSQGVGFQVVPELLQISLDRVDISQRSMVCR
ncbi:MAG: hypothetical protein M9909_07755 [Thermomicrobiales bacterium]|nr:hypothetical protein [Thermomicrobiales bacterium]